MKNGYDNDIVAGIDIGSENIFCSIGIVEEEKNNIKNVKIEDGEITAWKNKQAYMKKK